EPGDGVHLRRTLPDVRGGARLGRAGPHRVCDVFGAVGRMVARDGRGASARPPAADPGSAARRRRRRSGAGAGGGSARASPALLRENGGAEVGTGKSPLRGETPT